LKQIKIKIFSEQQTLKILLHVTHSERENVVSLLLNHYRTFQGFSFRLRAPREESFSTMTFKGMSEKDPFPAAHSIK
jgi:hypothetical protein